MFRRYSILASMFAFALPAPALAEPAAPEPPASVLFNNVKIFDGKGGVVTGPSNVLVTGKQISKISSEAIATDKAARVTVINGGGRVLMPGLIDAHTHIMFSSLPKAALLTADLSFLTIVATKEAEATLMRGFTSIRDVGGPSLGLKAAIDAGIVPGPRIWSSGAMISQTGGHGDFRLPNELPAEPGSMNYSERTGAAMIADDEGMVRKRVREQLALGASQIKLMAGGGVSSNFDPLDVAQYSVPELRAAVEAAENWGTYVTVHAYTRRAVQQAIAAGVKCIEHGNMLDEEAAKSMAEHGTWWSMQPFSDDRPSAFAEGTPNRIKQLTMYSGTDTAYQLAKTYKIKTAWGTDALYSPETAAQQGYMLSKMVKWYTPPEALAMATSGNAELLAMSGPRTPYPGKLGVVEAGALADLILVDGDPAKDLSLVADAAKNFVIIMKDGKIYKNSVK
jgi:imidazolonepropionase-like amidohydrolase